METNKEITDIFGLLENRNLRMAIDRLESFGYKYPELRLTSSVERIRSDYDLMASYWQRGYKDTSLGNVYDDLISKTYRIAADAGTAYAISHNNFLSTVYRRTRANGRDDSCLATARGELESFVSDMAMLDLEPEQVKEEKKKNLYAKHQAYINDLFDYIWTSSQWSDGTTEQVRQLLLSPTVDTMDQQMIVSAVTLCGINIFDINKLRLLAEVYRESGDESVRQRALVGVVFTLRNGDTKLFSAVSQIVDELLQDERTRSQLTELQIQLLYCISAESDTRTIQEQIIPDIIKHNNLHITSKGIEEKEDDPMEDILDPDASERNMERLEENMKRMIDMQKAGADIYFGGFMQMKRFPFFDTVSNWFTPYYLEHPAISSLYLNQADRNIVNNMIGRVAFCNSDKYSFVIAFQKVVDKLPANLREMLASGGATMVGETVNPDMETPAYIRRMYLQDFYRFFRLFHSRNCFNSPFEVYSDNGEAPGYVFFANPVFRGTSLEGSFNEIVACMTKRKLYADALDVLHNYSDKGKDYQYAMLCGNMLLHHRNMATMHGFADVEASDCFGLAMRLKPADTKVLFGYARALFYKGNYAEAADAYKKLMDAQPDSKSYILGYCVCLTNLERYDETLQLLYKLDYEYPDDYTVKRVLARTLVGSCKYEQALKIYEVLGTESEDVVNRGYCEWFMGDVQSAIGHFAEYITQRYPDADTETKRQHCRADVVESEWAFIKSHGVSATEAQLMEDAIRDAIIR